MRHTYLIGPGGVGKSSTGKILAERIGRHFVDLDEQFCNQISPIRSFLDEHGYPAYLRRNSLLFRNLLHDAKQPTIFALSSGFLVSDSELELLSENQKLLKKTGTTVLLMPSRSFSESLEVVVNRQMNRGLCLDRSSQVATFSARFHPYMELGDIQIVSTLLPEETAALIASRIQHCMLHETLSAGS